MNSEFDELTLTTKYTASPCTFTAAAQANPNLLQRLCERVDVQPTEGRVIHLIAAQTRHTEIDQGEQNDGAGVAKEQNHHQIDCRRVRERVIPVVPTPSERGGVQTRYRR